MKNKFLAIGLTALLLGGCASGQKQAPPPQVLAPQIAPKMQYGHASTNRYVTITNAGTANAVTNIVEHVFDENGTGGPPPVNPAVIIPGHPTTMGGANSAPPGWSMVDGQWVQTALPKTTSGITRYYDPQQDQPQAPQVIVVQQPKRHWYTIGGGSPQPTVVYQPGPPPRDPNNPQGYLRPGGYYAGD